MSQYVAVIRALTVRGRGPRRNEKRGDVLENLRVVAVTHGFELLRDHELTLPPRGSDFEGPPEPAVGS